MSVTLSCKPLPAIASFFFFFFYLMKNFKWLHKCCGFTHIHQTSEGFKPRRWYRSFGDCVRKHIICRATHCGDPSWISELKAAILQGAVHTGVNTSKCSHLCRLKLLILDRHVSFCTFFSCFGNSLIVFFSTGSYLHLNFIWTDFKG